MEEVGEVSMTCEGNARGRDGSDGEVCDGDLPTVSIPTASVSLQDFLSQVY